MNNKILKDLLFDIQVLENENKNYSKKTNEIILNLIKNVKEDSNIDIELYSPTKKSNSEFLKYIGKYFKITKKKNMLNKTCSICLNNYKINEFYRKLPDCNHVFHKKCIDKWLKLDYKKKCPICYLSYDYITHKCSFNNYIKL